MNEFDLIQKYLVPLAEHFAGSLNLSDDAAIITPPSGHDLIVTKDAIAEGVHYLPGTPPSLIARKLLRTNLSDLAAKGATPLCYFLSLALPKPLSEDFIRDFAHGLAIDQSLYNIHLAGGDTIAANAPVFSITAHGLVPSGSMLKRSGAKAGDDIYVSGTLGDAALGLWQIRNHSPGAPTHLTQRYHLPEPRMALGRALRGPATSGMDISDGLLQDASHIAHVSSVGMVIHEELLPLSDEARALIAHEPSLAPLVYNGGDDYELLFTLPKGSAPPTGHAVTKIGEVTEGSEVKLLRDGNEVVVSSKGYSH